MTTPTIFLSNVLSLNALSSNYRYPVSKECIFFRIHEPTAHIIRGSPMDVIRMKNLPENLRWISNGESVL